MAGGMQEADILAGLRQGQNEGAKKFAMLYRAKQRQDLY